VFIAAVVAYVVAATGIVLGTLVALATLLPFDNAIARRACPPDHR
jgi:hypothetical protein